MTTPEEICREEFTQDQLNKLINRASWEALFPLAVEMGFDLNEMSRLNYNYLELRTLMRRTWREKVSRFCLCQRSYEKVRKEMEKQRQILMDYHFKEKSK